MGVYNSECGECGKQYEYVKPVAECLDTPECCGSKTNKVILQAPMIGALAFAGRHKAFHVPGAANDGKGTWIETGYELKQYMKKNNLVSESEGTSEAELQRKRRKQDEKAKLHATVEKVVSEAMPL